MSTRPGFTTATSRPDLGAAAGPLAAALTIVAATLSWRIVEKPVMRRVRTWDSP